ncbi:alpha/beta fold hydrolase [Amycolatopsis sp. NPDC059657]|uniref:alpha/beta fold hydrolase n=1 Tax=Amycolatopsis sp. NPDC059657 TaxID=3346899 RepID=UPI003671B3A1
MFTSPYGPIAQLSTPPGDAVALLVPGYTGSKEDFTPLLDGFAAAGFQAIAIDLPGQYESPGPEDEAAYSPRALGTIVASVIASFDQPVFLLGHSYGGLVARGAILAGAKVAGLTLMDTGPGPLTSLPRLEALTLGETQLRAGDVEGAYAIRDQVQSRFPGWVALDEELKAFYRKRFLATHPACLLGMGHWLRSEPDLVDELTLALGKTPSVVITGEHDDAWSVAEQQEMARRLNVPFLKVRGAAHSPNTENPAELLAQLIPLWRTWLKLG